MVAIPPFLIGLLKKVAVPLIMELGRKLISTIGKTPAMNEGNKPMDIEQLGEALSELREYVMQESRPIFQEASQSITSYVEEQFFSMDDKAKLFEKYHISVKDTIEKLRHIQCGLDGHWNDAMYRRISFDDARCRAILSLPAGEKKQADMARFTHEVVVEVLAEQAETIRSDLDDLYGSLEKRILRSVQKLESTAQEYRELVNSMDEKNEDKHEHLLGRALMQAHIYGIIAEKARE